MTKKTKAEMVDPERVCILQTTVGQNLVIRANPSVNDVREFVAEQLRRHQAGEPAGHDPGVRAFQIHNATFYDSEIELTNPEEVDLTDVLVPAGK